MLAAMASLRKEIHINVPPARVWDALRDVGALHQRLVPGFVTDTRMEDGARVVTFGNGMVAREHIVDVDESRRRVCWAVLDPPFEHYNGTAWVEPDINGGSRFVWTADLLPHDLGEQVGQMMDAGLAVAKETLERAYRNPGPLLNP